MTTQNTDHPAPQFPCPLCRTPSPAYYSDEYYRCPACEGIFRNPGRLLSPDAEQARYERHQNNPDDPGYRAFVSPLVAAITNHLPPGSRGLDFGAGPGPVVSAMLREQGYRTDLYDPFFHLDRRPLEQTWDFVFCCEVIEHFYHPADEFARLYSLLRPGAPLFCMTHIHTDDIDFPTWYYKNDETHTFIYREKTLRTITRLIGFTTCTIDGRVIRFDTPAPAGTVAGAGAMDPARALSPAKALIPGEIAPIAKAESAAGALFPAEALNPAKALNPGEVAPIAKAESPAGVANPAGALNPAAVSTAGVLFPAEALNPAKALNPGEVTPIAKAESPAGALFPGEALKPTELSPGEVLLPGEVTPIAKAESPAGVANPGAIPRAEGPDVRP